MIKPTIYTKHIVFIMLFFVSLGSLSLANGKQHPTTSAPQKIQNTPIKKNTELETIKNDLRALTTSYNQTTQSIEDIRNLIDTQNVALGYLKQEACGLNTSKRSFEDFSCYGDSIGLTSVLVGVMSVVLTAIALIIGISFYKYHNAFERQKNSLITEAKSDIKKQVQLFLKEDIRPEVAKEINKLDKKFWQRTYIGRKLENEYWINLIKTEPDIEKRLDRDNKFKIAVAKILSEEDIDGGLAFFSSFNSSDLPPSFENFLYKLYQQGLFINETVFPDLIQKLFYLELLPWLDKIRVQIEEENMYRTMSQL